MLERLDAAVEAALGPLQVAVQSNAAGDTLQNQAQVDDMRSALKTLNV